MVTKTNGIQQLLFRQVSIAPLIAFRIIFGALMLFGTLRFISRGWVYDLYIAPNFHFSYWGFEWIKPLPGDWMYLPFALMVIACVGIIFGAFYRISSLMFFLSFTYVELIDKAYYLNHYYFVSLIAFYLVFLPANADFSVDSLRKPILLKNKIPYWPIGILKIQLGIVYFFAGLAKVQPDWLLEAQPLKIWLQAHRDLPVVGSLLASTWLAFVFSWFGCIYDLSIPFLLHWKKTRLLAYLMVIAFHILTWLLFPIGVFPWVMICCTLIYFSAEFHEKWLLKLKTWLSWNPVQEVRTIEPKRKLITSIILFFLGIQLILPFRYLAYPGELFWHEQGFRFSWRVMLMHKEGHATFYVLDRKSKGRIELFNGDYLSEVQEDQMSTQPDMILQYAHHLHKIWKDTTLQFDQQSARIINPEIRAKVYVALNGRPAKAFVSDQHDLSAISLTFKPITWIEPF